jgi:hypothetical protein
VDFRLYARVLWRFRLLVVAGVILATSLALLSQVRISSSGITYRQTELWSSTMRLLVTQHGFPEGRLFGEVPSTDGQSQSGDETIPVVNPDRLTSLAVLYADLAVSDPVRRVMLLDGPVRGKIVATPLIADKTNAPLPLIDLTAIATSQKSALGLARRGAGALETYIEREQRTNKVPEADRVVVQTIVQPKRATIYRPRSKTMPIVIFLAVMFAVVGLAFVLENARPRMQALEPPVESEFRDSGKRRTA